MRFTGSRFRRKLCGICRNGPADYVLFVGLTPVAVVEAKRQRRDVAGAIEQARPICRGGGCDTPARPGHSAILSYKRE